MADTLKPRTAKDVEEAVQWALSRVARSSSSAVGPSARSGGRRRVT